MVDFLMRILPLLSVNVVSSTLSIRWVAMNNDTPAELLVWLLVKRIPWDEILLIICICVPSVRCVSCMAHMSVSVIIFCITGYFFFDNPLMFRVLILIECFLWVLLSAYSVDVWASNCGSVLLSLWIGSESEGKACMYSSVVREDGSGGCVVFWLLFGPSVSIVKGTRFTIASLCLMIFLLCLGGVF